MEFFCMVTFPKFALFKFTGWIIDFKGSFSWLQYGWSVTWQACCISWFTSLVLHPQVFQTVWLAELYGLLGGLQNAESAAYRFIFFHGFYTLHMTCFWLLFLMRILVTCIFFQSCFSQRLLRVGFRWFNPLLKVHNTENLCITWR